MNRESLDRWCERGILAFVLGVLVFSPLAYGAVRIQEFLVVQLFTLGALVLWLARVWLSERPKFLLPPMIWGVLAFTGYAVGRYYTCDVEYIGREEVLRIVVYASLFFVVLNNLHRQEHTQIIGFTLFGLAVAIAGYAAYQFLTGSDLVWFTNSGYKGRGSGTYICPNHLAGLLEMLLPIAVAYAVVGRGKPLTKILIAYAALVMVAGIVMTSSRGGWVAVSLALIGVCVAMLSQRAFRLPAAILLVLLIGGGTVVATRTNFFKEHFLKRTIVAGRVDMDVRYEMWNGAVQMWRDHKWVGVGPGHYDLRFRIYRPASLQLQPDRAHNEYLNTLADWGIVGAALIMVLVAVHGSLGQGSAKARFTQMFSNTRAVNLLSAARVFLFASRDVWFVVGLPVYLRSVLGWTFWEVGGFMAIWVIGYGIVQSASPRLLKRRSGHVPTGRTAALLALGLAILPAGIAVALRLNFDPATVLVVGLVIFGVVFALNSAVHSFLILHYADGDKVAMNVGFYYMANAFGRLAGTILSGLLYEWQGLEACLWASAIMVVAAGLISLALPGSPRHAIPVVAPTS